MSTKLCQKHSDEFFTKDDEIYSTGNHFLEKCEIKDCKELWKNWYVRTLTVISSEATKKNNIIEEKK